MRSDEAINSYKLFLIFNCFFLFSWYCKYFRYKDFISLNLLRAIVANTHHRFVIRHWYHNNRDNKFSTHNFVTIKILTAVKLSRIIISSSNYRIIIGVHLQKLRASKIMHKINLKFLQREKIRELIKSKKQ